MTLNRRWSRAIKRRLDEWDMTQTEMGQILEEPVQRVSDWARGIYEPSDAVKVKLMERLGIEPDEVVPEWLRGAVTPPLPPRPTVDNSGKAA